MTEYKSKEELYFSWWLDDCIAAGLISSYEYEPETFKLSDRAVYHFEKYLKTKTKTAEKTLIRGKSYTPDFKIHVTNLGIAVIAGLQNLEFPLYMDSDYICRIDVKGGFSKNNEARIFSLTQAWLHAVRGIYVQKIVIANKPKCFFEKTFTPQQFLPTDKSGKRRKLNYEARTVDGFCMKN